MTPTVALLTIGFLALLIASLIALARWVAREKRETARIAGKGRVR